MVMGSLPQRVDLAIIGGGVGGYVAAIRAAQLGLSVGLVEKNKLGGHCLNYACIPSKTLIKISDIFYEVQHSEKFGINAQGVTLDAKKMLDWRMSVSKKLEDGVAFLCKMNSIDVFKGTGAFLDSNHVQLSDGITLEFKKAIIATGSEPVVIPGFEFGGNIIDYKQALMLDHIPRTMLIIGAGYVAVEIGTLYAKFGTTVTILARSDVLSRFDRDAVDLVKKRMTALGVKILTGVMPKRRDGSAVLLSDNSSVEAEYIVVATGLRPYTEGLELDKTKVVLDEKGFVVIDKKMQTGDPNILAVGDVTGEPLLAHKAMRQGVIAAEVAAGKNSEFDNLAIPSVIFSDPEIAITGTIEEDGVKVAKFPLSALGKAIAFDTTSGFVKIAYDADNVVKGVEIVGPDANVMIAEATLAIEMGATLDDIAETIHAHPTYSEAVQEAAEAGLGQGIHFFYGKPAQKPDE